MTIGINGRRPRRESDGIVGARPRCIWTVRHKEVGFSHGADHGLCGRAIAIGRHYQGLSTGAFLQAVSFITWGGREYDRAKLPDYGEICQACEHICLDHFFDATRTAA